MYNFDVDIQTVGNFYVNILTVGNFDADKITWQQFFFLLFCVVEGGLGA
jgi:hypothetical protein